MVCTLVDVNSIHGLLKFDLGWDGDNETGHARMIHYLERISAKINDIFGSNKAIWIIGIDFLLIMIIKSHRKYFVMQAYEKILLMV